MGFSWRVWFGVVLTTALMAVSAAEISQECIQEPVFEGKVCIEQMNPNGATGVILIHGLGGSTDDWRETLPALARDFHVVAFDLPGFGKSDKGSQNYTPTAYAHLARFLADRYFSNKPYHIVGHSMGAAIALRFAGQRPLRFQRLVLIDAAGILHPLVLSKYGAGSFVERTSGIRQTRDLAERISSRILEKVDALPFMPNDIAATTLGRDVMLQGGPEKIAAMALSGENFSYAIATVAEPTLILWGRDDRTVPMRTGEVLAANMPHARLQIIEGAGHTPMADQGKETNALILGHLLAGARDLNDQLARQKEKKGSNSSRTASCNGESGKKYTGDYQTIEIRDCSNVSIANARIGQLSVINSRVTLLNTRVMGTEEGIHADNSELTITNGEISAATAINAVNSNFDIAGAYLNGSANAVKATASKFVFSVSRIKSPQQEGAIHDYKKIEDGVL